MELGVVDGFDGRPAIERDDDGVVRALGRVRPGLEPAHIERINNNELPSTTINSTWWTCHACPGHVALARSTSEPLTLNAVECNILKMEHATKIVGEVGIKSEWASLCYVTNYILIPT